MERIEEEIEKIRELLVNKVSQKGIDHPEVIKISQKLDLLHIEYIKMQNEKK